MARNRGRYCYICQCIGPCNDTAPCHKLKGAEKVRAYNEGYRKAHPEVFNQASKAHYHKLHPHAVSRETRTRRAIDKEAE